MSELSSGAIDAVHINRDGSWMVVCGGGKAAGKWVEMEECDGEGFLKAVKKSYHKAVSVVGRFAKEKTFLNVLNGKQGEIPMGQIIGVICLLGKAFWFDKTVGDPSE